MKLLGQLKKLPKYIHGIILGLFGPWPIATEFRFVNNTEIHIGRDTLLLFTLFTSISVYIYICILYITIYNIVHHIASIHICTNIPMTMCYLDHFAAILHSVSFSIYSRLVNASSLVWPSFASLNQYCLPRPFGLRMVSAAS